MTTRPFANNLRKLDRVYDTESNRFGVVARNVRPETSRSTAVTLDGTNTPRYIDVMQLRLVLDGEVAEDVPPIDGEPPAESAKASSAPPPPPPQADVLTTMKAQLQKNNEEMFACTDRYKKLKGDNERLDKAIAVMEAP